MSGLEMLTLATAALAAGAINAVAGGGTLLTFPTLLLCGTPPIVANATSTLALVIGTAGSIFGFRSQIAAVKPWLGRFVPVSLLGGWMGSVLLTRLGNEIFATLVPFLILFATVLFLAQGAFRRLAGRETAAHAAHPSVWIAVAFQFAVAVYGGYFGAGIGIMMLATLGLLGLRDMNQMNALKVILALLMNLAAVVYFIVKGSVAWHWALWLMGGSMSGYYFGSHLAMRIPGVWVRAAGSAIGLIICVELFWKQLHR